MMYSNNIVNFKESTTILNAFKKSLETYWIHHVYIYIYIYIRISDKQSFIKKTQKFSNKK